MGEYGWYYTSPGCGWGYARSFSTAAAIGGGMPLDPLLWPLPRDGGGAVVWERAGAVTH